MRIAYISYELPPDIPKGGIGTYTMQAASLMQTSGNDIHIFSGSYERGMDEIQSGVTIHRIICADPHDFTEKVTETFSKVHTVLPFDMIECPEIHGNGTMIKKQFPHLPLIVRLHAPNQLVESLKKTYTPFIAKARFTAGALVRGNFGKTWGSYDKDSDPDYFFVKQANVITAPSAAMKDWAVNNWNIDPEKIKIIPNPFKAPEQLIKMPVAETASQKRILFFGRLNVLKGPVNFTKAIDHFLEDHPDWRVTVIGDDAPGPHNEVSMRNWMKDYLGDEAKKVSFLDGMQQAELYERMNDCEIVVLPSLFETFSYACAEAMAAGKAIAGSNSGGMADLLENGAAGLCIDPDNPEEIYKAILQLAEDNDLRVRLSTAAKKIMSGAIYNENVVKEMNNIYENILTNGSA